MNHVKTFTLCAMIALVVSPAGAAQDNKDFILCDRNANTSCFEQFLDRAKADPRAFRDVRSQTPYGQLRIWVALVNTPRPYIRFYGPDDNYVEDLRNGQSVNLVSKKLLSSDSLVAAAYAQMYLAGLAESKSECPATLQDSEYAALKSLIDKAHRRLNLLEQSFIRTQNHGVWQCETSICCQVSAEEAAQIMADTRQYYFYHAEKYDAYQAAQK